MATGDTPDRSAGDICSTRMCDMFAHRFSPSIRISALKRCQDLGVLLNGFAPSRFGENSLFRSECLNTHWFPTLADAARKMEDRPHGAIGNIAPILLHKLNGAASLPMSKRSENATLGRSNFW